MKKYVALSVIIALAVVSALAVPVIQLIVQQLGAGYSAILSPVSKGWVNHIFAIKDFKIVLDKIKVKFDKELPAGTYIRIELRDNNDNVLTSGSITLSDNTPAGTWIYIDLNPDLGLYDLVKYQKIVVVVAGPEVGT
mgnify:CR=1 FL=1